MDSDGKVSAAALSRPVRVWCRGGYHVVGLVGGKVHALSHTAAEVEHELATQTGSGRQVYGCFAMLAEGYRQRLRQLLRSAIGRNDLADVLDLVRAGVDPNTRVRSHRSALSVAIMHRSPDAVRELLRAGADPRLLGRYWGSPLSLAVAVGDPEIIRLLIDAGADPTAPDWFGQTCLDLVIDRGDADVARAVVASRAPVDSSELLSRAVTAGNTPVVRVALAAGADPNTRSAQGNTPLHLAARANQMPSAQLLLAAGADRRGRNQTGQTPAALASTHRHNDMMLLLISDDPTLPDAAPMYPPAVRDAATPDRDPPEPAIPDIRHGWTPLHHAAHNGHGQQVEELLAAGADQNARTPTGLTALHLAIAFRHPVVARKLLAAGADIDSETHGGVTPLGLAVFLSHYGMVRLLLAAGADVTRDQGSLLHEAVRGGNRTIIELLLSHGIDRTVRDGDGRTAADVAAEQGDADLVHLLTATDQGNVARVIRLRRRTAR
ncbi:ankyrin repeat domain-containing protein [Nocardia sp. NPDC050406]|uniref:ankyrin repeat domain-containing protein n=1 Tax=Nocardia sp. NPDC050406 TaxID=3364318 RepID=UPI00379872E5